MNNLLTFFIFFCTSYTFFLYFSHPQKKKRVIPRIHFKNIEILPNFRIHFRNTTYHVHHWLLLTLITMWALFFYDTLLQLVAVKAFAAGGIVQGLRYKDRFHFRIPRLSR